MYLKLSLQCQTASIRSLHLVIYMQTPSTDICSMISSLEAHMEEPKFKGNSLCLQTMVEPHGLFF